MGGGIQIENWKSGFVNSVIVSHEPENLYLWLIGKFLKKSCKNNQKMFFSQNTTDKKHLHEKTANQQIID